MVVEIPRVSQAEFLSELEVLFVPLHVLDFSERNVVHFKVVLVRSRQSQSWYFVSHPSIVMSVDCQKHILQVRVKLEVEHDKESDTDSQVAQSQHFFCFEQQLDPAVELLPIRHYVIKPVLGQQLQLVLPVLLNLGVHGIKHLVSAEQVLRSNLVSCRHFLNIWQVLKQNLSFYFAQLVHHFFL